MDVDCSFLLGDGGSEFKFLYIIAQQFFLHVHKTVAFPPLLLIETKDYSILFLFCNWVPLFISKNFHSMATLRRESHIHGTSSVAD